MDSKCIYSTLPIRNFDAASASYDNPSLFILFYFFFYIIVPILPPLSITATLTALQIIVGFNPVFIYTKAMALFLSSILIWRGAFYRRLNAFFDLVILEETNRTYSWVAERERERLKREESAREGFRSLRAKVEGQ